MAMLRKSVAGAGCAGQKHLAAGLAILPDFQVSKNTPEEARRLSVELLLTVLIPYV
jgi:hypothetical protein